MNTRSTCDKLLSAIAILLTLLLAGCGAGAGVEADNGAFAEAIENSPTPRSCSVEGMNTWVHESMQDYYLFYDQVDRNLNPATFESPEQFIRELRVQPNDTFSYVSDERSFNALFSEGETFGYGWSFGRDENNKLLFALVAPNSPLALAGVQRGEELLAIDSMPIDDFVQLSNSAKDEILGTGDEPRTITLTVGNTDQQIREVSVTRGLYSVQTVLDTRVIPRNTGDVGYLHFYQFISNSSDELETAFSTLKEAGVTELVLDLRFNRGGRISIANELASAIVGNNHGNDVFATYAFNDKYDDNNVSLRFQNMTNSLTLNRVFVLQSDSTCSASELVVNSLRPFMEVITVGETSCGKPYATSPKYGCGKVINALEIELLNANGAGGYFDGIAADCSVAENLRTELGDTNEPLLSAALRYIDVGSCATTPRTARHSGHRLTREFKQEWQAGGSL